MQKGLIYLDVQQKLTQHGKATTLQLEKKSLDFLKSINFPGSVFHHSSE